MKTCETRALPLWMLLAMALLSGRQAALSQTSVVGYWDLNSYNPGTQTTSLANAGAQAGTAVLDWSSFGVINAQTPAPSGLADNLQFSSAPGTALGLMNNHSFDVRLSTSGLDFVDLSYAGGVAGNWTWSVDGTHFFNANVVPLSANHLQFTDARLANQSSVDLRFTQPGTLNQFVAYDNVLATAQAYNGLAMGGSIANGLGDVRAVKGAEVIANYTLFDRAGVSQNYSLTTVGLENVNDLVNPGKPSSINGADSALTVGSFGANPISGVIKTADASAGDTLNGTVTATSTTEGVGPVSKTLSVQVLENRTLARQGDGNLGNLGRIVGGTSLGSMTIGTDDKTDSQATRISLSSGTYNNGNLAFTSGSQVFNDANQTASVAVHLNTSVLGTQTIGGDFKNATYTTYDYKRNAQGYYEYVPVYHGAFSAEKDVQGSDLSKVGALAWSGTATVLANRQINVDAINLGRQMVSSGTENLVGSQTVSIRGGTLTDDQGTRVVLNSTGSPVSQQGVTVSLPTGRTFDGANQTADANVSYNVNFNRGVAGTQSASANIAGQLANGEAPSVAGVALSSYLPVTVQKTYVQNRQLFAAQNSVVVRSLAGYNVNAIGNTIYTAGSDDQYTRLTVNGSSMRNDYSAAYDAVTVNHSSPVSTGVIMLGNHSPNVTGEGLAGESVASVSWNYGVQYYQGAAASVSANVGGVANAISMDGPPTGLTLDVGDSITVATAAKNDGGNGQRADTWVATGFVGNNGFSLNGLGSTIAAGNTQVGTVAFDSSGKLNGIHSALLQLSLGNDQTLAGASYGDLGSTSFDVRHVVTGNSGLGGSAYVASGTSLKDAGINSSFASSVLSQKTEFALKDSVALPGNVEIQVAFGGINSAGGTGAQKLVSDTLSLSGLDGIQFVLQVSYDEATLLRKFGTENVALLTWLDPADQTWKNAIEGNSTFGVDGSPNEFGRRFAESYDAYLASVGGSPVLNDYGYDTTDNVMWAVLDHNSTFAGSGIQPVPEPSSAALALLGLCALACIRRKMRGQG